MSQSDSLEFVAPGTLIRPGPVGRIVRMLLGAFCLFALAELLIYAQWTTAEPASSLPNRILVLLAPLLIFNYVINIGYSKNWGQKPLTVSIFILGVFAIAAYTATGNFNSPVLGLPLNLWLVYFYSHLGIAFVLSAILATPGCEMRSIPELIGMITGKPSQEHSCPVAFITKIDDWEQRKFPTKTD